VNPLRHFVYVWVGLKDYLQESCRQGSDVQLRANAKLLGLPMRAVGGFLGVVAAALAAKLGMSQMTSGNSEAYLLAGGVFLALAGLWLLVLAPARWLWRAWSFVKMLHHRGELLCEGPKNP
jgi:hypothetical protein